MLDSPRRKMISFGEAAVYRIAVQGHISAETAGCLGRMEVVTTDSTTPSGVTVLVGKLSDQAELCGVLNTLYEMHLPILEVTNLIEADDAQDGRTSRGIFEEG